MTIVKKVGEYDQTIPCKVELKKYTMFSHVSGLSAMILIYLLKSPMITYFQNLFSTMFEINFLRNIECVDEPNDYPIVKSDTEESNELIDLNAVLLKKSDWPYKTIFDYNSAYLSKNSSPIKVVTRILELIELEPMKSLHPISQIDRENLFKEAQESTNRFESSKPISVLDGIPFVVKDDIKIKNMIYLLGTDLLKTAPDYTATIVIKLRQQGCLLIGTATMSTFHRNIVGYNTSKTFPTSPNPFDTKRYPGGSSSGSAVSVASGIVPFALGTDALGSIRIPASFTGIVGLKPTLTRISNYGIAESEDIQPLCVGGPLASCVSDAALVYSVISGSDELFPLGMSQPAPIFPKWNKFDIKSIKFGIFHEFNKWADENQIDSLNEVCLKIKESESSIVDVNIPELQESITFAMLLLVKAASKLPIILKDPDIRWKSNDISLIIVGLVGDCLTNDDMLKIKKQRTRSVDIMKKLFETIDILILPSTCTTAPKIVKSDKTRGCFDHNTFLSTTFFVSLANFTGCPAISLNVGYEPETNMPISVQLISKWWSEDILLSAANWIEQMFPLSRKPQVLVDPLIQ